MKRSKARSSLKSKLLPPRIDERMLDRPRLTNRSVSDTISSTIYLIVAPAGYGKTVLMSQYCEFKASPVVWYQFDAHDDPASFINHLSTEIKQVSPQFGKRTAALLKKTGALNRPSSIISEFFQELSIHCNERLLLALDDYHFLKEPAMHGFMEQLLTHLPEHVDVCLASRTPLPFSLSRLEINGRVVHIDSETIRFSREEIASYLDIESPKDDRVERIGQQTEGWPVALRLIKNALSQDQNWELDRSPQLFHYLANEVLENQPAELQHFLRTTSVLDILTPEICDRLLERTDSDRILKELNRQQLFVSPLASGHAYRYHQLFREFLLNSLGYEDKVLFYKAGTIAQDIGNTEHAIHYFAIAEAHHEVARLIIKHGQQALERGHWEMVEEWLSRIPSKLLMSEPWLILYQAEVEIIRGRLVEADHLLEKAKSLFDSEDNIHGLSGCLCQQARLMRSRGFYFKSLKLMDEALSYSYTHKFEKRIDFSIEKGFVLVLAGKFDESEAELTEALSFAEDEGDTYMIASFSEALSNLYFLKGDYARSMEMYQRAVNVSSEPVQTSYTMRDSVALIFRDWGELERALEHAHRSIAVKEKLGLLEVLPYAYYQLASIQTDLGDYAQAEANYRHSIEITKQTGGEQVFRIMSTSMLAKLLSSQNRFVEAADLAEKAMALSKSQSPYVIAFTNEMVAPVLMQTGRASEAVQMLFESTAVLEQVGAKYPLCIAYGALTTILLMMGENDKAEDYAARCLALASRENYLQIFISTFDLFQPALEIGLKQGNETLFIQKILVRLGTQALDLISRLASSSKAQVRRRTIIPLAEIGGDRAEQLIRSLSKDPDADTSVLARQMAERAGLPGSVEVMESSSAPLQLEMLGSFGITVAGTVKSTDKWKTLKSRDLLAYLAHSGEAVSKGRILEDLWPDMNHKRRSQLFHTTMYNLRQFFKKNYQLPDIVLYTGGKYTLNKTIYTSDRRQFEQLLKRTLKPKESDEAMISTLTKAIELYRGEYLSDMDYAWLILDREYLDISYLRALKKLSQLYLNAEEISQAIHYLHILSSKDPFDEDVCQMLMTAYANTESPAMIKRTYQSFTHSLDSELGIAPSPATTRLYDELIQIANPGSGLSF